MEDLNFIDINDDISIIDDYNTQKKNGPGKKKTSVWNYFEEIGEKKHGHVGCHCKACGWIRKVGKAYEMVDHLAFKCLKVSGEVKATFLQEVKARPSLDVATSSTTTSTSSTITTTTSSKRVKLQDQKKITAMFENTKIDTSKVQRCNRALTRFFICCGIPFYVIANPFFIDFVKSLCPSYELPNRITFAGSWVNQELAHVTCDILDVIRDSDNITLGLFIYFLLLIVNII